MIYYQLIMHKLDILSYLGNRDILHDRKHCSLGEIQSLNRCWTKANNCFSHSW